MSQPSGMFEKLSQKCAANLMRFLLIHPLFAQNNLYEANTIIQDSYFNSEGQESAKHRGNRTEL